jgi:hypothetical protein
VAGTYKVTGAPEVMKRLREAQESIPDALAAALYTEGFATDAEMVRRIPVDTGRLRASHYVAPPTGSRNPVVQVGVGTKYAIPVHERTEVHHEVGQAKYLESVLNERRSGYARRLADWAWDYFKRGIGVKSIPATAPSRPMD